MGTALILPNRRSCRRGSAMLLLRSLPAFARLGGGEITDAGDWFIVPRSRSSQMISSAAARQLTSRRSSQVLF